MSDFKIYNTSGGAYKVDVSQLDPADRSRLDQLARTGKMAPQDLVSVLGKYPDVYQLVTDQRELLAPNGGSYQRPPYEAIELDIGSLVSICHRALAESSRELRHGYLKQAMVERENIMVSAETAYHMEMDAAEANFRAGVAEGAAGIVGAGIQGGFSFKGMNDLRISTGKTMRSNGISDAADVRTARMNQQRAAGRAEINGLKSDHGKAKIARADCEKVATQAEAKVQSTTRKLAEKHHEHQACIQKHGKADKKLAQEHDDLKAQLDADKAELATARADVKAGTKKCADLEVVIRATEAEHAAYKRKEGHQIGLERTDARRLTEGADLRTKLSHCWSSFGTGIGQLCNSSGRLVAAFYTLQGAELTAESKLVHARGDLANMMYSQLLDFANSSRDFINEMRNAEGSEAQSSQQTWNNVARNI